MTEERSQQNQFVYEEERSGGHPLIATLICAVVLFFVELGAREDANAGHDLAYLLGYVTASGMFGGLCWGVAYAVTIKNASNGWRVGSLIALIVVGVLAGLLNIGSEPALQRSDARDTVNQLQQVLEGDKLPDHVAAGRGPLSRMSAAFMNRVLQDQRDLERDLTAAGFVEVVRLEGLTRESPVLRHCGDFAPLAVRARSLGTEGRQANLAAARQVGDAAVRAGEMAARDEADFFEGAERSRGSYERQWALNAEVVEEGQAVCTLLASRPWVRSGGRVLFTRPGDAEVVNGHLRRIQAAGAEQDRMREQYRRDTRAQLETMEH